MGIEGISRDAQAGEADEAQLLQSVDRRVERELKPIVKSYDHADRYPTHIVEQLKEFGLFGATIGADYGGLASPGECLCAVMAVRRSDGMFAR